jgi:hypothetical protein
MVHNLRQFLVLAGLQAEFDADKAAGPELLANWDTVQNWSESNRYARTTRADAKELYDATTNKKHGVLSWTQSRW